MDKIFGTMAWSTVLSAAFTFVVCLIALNILLKIVDRLLGGMTKLDNTLKGFIRGTAKTFLWILTIIIVAGALGIPTSSLVALISIAGAALSLSLQGTLQNLFAGLTLLVTRPFQAGDFVEVGGRTGTVKTVGLFYTQLNTLDNILVSIPNKDVTGTALNNYSKEENRRVDLTISASYDSPTEAVRGAILEVINQDSRILLEPAPFVRLSNYGDNAIEYTIRVWCRSADYWDVHFDLLEQIRESFDRNGVVMTYPHVIVHTAEK